MCVVEPWKYGTGKGRHISIHSQVTEISWGIKSFDNSVFNSLLHSFLFRSALWLILWQYISLSFPQFPETNEIL